MARLNIEDHAFGDPRLFRLARLLNVHTNWAFGALCRIWHESQSEMISEATECQLALWADAECSDDLFSSALVKSGYVDKTPGGLFLIHGNTSQIEKLKRFGIKQRNNGKKGGRPNKPTETQNNPDEAKPSPENPNTNTNTNTNTNLERDTPVSLPVSAKQAPVDYQGFISAWNENRGQLPECKKIGESRKKKIKMRLAEESDMAYWVGAVQNLAASQFAVEGKWCDINWLIENDNNHRKATSGKYNQQKKHEVKLDFNYICGGKGKL